MKKFQLNENYQSEFTWLTDKFLQNKSNFFICSQFRLEENLFKKVFFFQVDIELYLTEENITLHATFLFKLVPAITFLSIEHWGWVWPAILLFKALCQSCSDVSAIWFLVIVKVASSKCENKQLLLLVKRKKVNLWCARLSIFSLKNRLKISTEAVLEHVQSWS